MDEKKRNVLVLMGGPSAEHEISLATGKVVSERLDRSRYAVRTVEIGKDGRWLLPVPSHQVLSGAKAVVALESGAAVARFKSSERIDVVFLALHGPYGEDGTVQGLLELAGISYTGSGVLASALAMDKVRSSELFAYHGLTVPRFRGFEKAQWEGRHEACIAEITEQLSFPVVVKPVANGSSFGIGVVQQPTALADAVEKAFQYDDRVMVQQYVAGTEVTCAVLDDGDDGDAEALPPTEIVPKKSSFFDFKAKYDPTASDEITPARLPENTLRRIQEIAKKAHQILGCSGMSRTDMIVEKQGTGNREQGSGTERKIFLLETNTIPGMTENSLLPKAAAAAGIPFPRLLDRIIAAALRRRSKPGGGAQ